MSVYGQILETSISSKINKDFKSKGKKSISEFKEENLSQDFIKENKSKYKLLSHIKENSIGYFYTDKENNFVAILSIEKKQNEEIWIQAIEIDKRYQGYGLSSQLLKIAIDKFKANFLSVNKKNEIAINLYIKNGFKIYKEIDNMYFMRRNK